jgi:glycine cleavage system aminomethyltransferase T
MTTTDWTGEARELDTRTGEGILVRLLWYAATDTTAVSVLDSTGEESFEIVVDAEQARDAFDHPFAYAAIGGVSFAALARAGAPERITL